MKMCGVFGLILTVVSLFFWLVSWVFFTFLLREIGYDSPLRLLAQLCGALSTLSTAGAIASVALGLLLASKPAPANGPRRDAHL